MSRKEGSKTLAVDKKLMLVSNAKSIVGEIEIPGDKSVSHRAAIFAAISKGETKISNFASSEDCTSTLECLRRLGVDFERIGATVRVQGLGKQGLMKPQTALDCGNSGTTMRLLAGILAGQEFNSELIGDESLSARPMNRIVLPLEKMGSLIKSENGKPPLQIIGKRLLSAMKYEMPIASAQLKSAILLAGLNADGKTVVRNLPSEKPFSMSRDHTELMLRHLSVEIGEEFLETDEGFVQEVSIDGNSVLSAKDMLVPGDVSSAAFFIVAASILPDSDITLKNVGLNPTRTAFIEVIKNAGARIESFNIRERNCETVGDLRIRSSKTLVADSDVIRLNGSEIANLIDEIPILAVLGTQLKGGLEVRDAAELRVKESDRISTVVKNLEEMDACVTEYEDGFRVEKSALKGAKVNSFGDHRIAMAFAIAGLFADGHTEIINAECANVSFPTFFEVLTKAVI